MIVTTTENVAGHRTVEAFGQVFGVVVRSRGLGGNIAAGLRSIVGGEIKEYTRMIEDARRQAPDRMIGNAVAMGANAVIMMRFDFLLYRSDHERGHRRWNGGAGSNPQ